ncbi:MAG: hypothetical protein K0S33_691 [Bacteroidetes bacterium]|jgi:hypothetical protein|nr:hypothetical protein [Bacteroidota bacterium]
MTRNVPHQTILDQARTLEKWQTRVLILSTISTIASLALNAFAANTYIKSHPGFLTWANATATLFSVAFIVLDVLINTRFYVGGREKRTDLIDHAFDTNFSGERSTGYFNPGGISPGVYKLAVLGFENSLFTCTVAKKMILRKWIITSVIFILFIVSACIGNKDLVNDLLQVTATGVLVLQAIRLQQFANRIGTIHEEFKTLFNRLENETDKSKSEGEMVKNVLNYEATIAWGTILTDTNIFDELNPALSAKWENMKQGYKI